jgi:hypothetical protein
MYANTKHKLQEPTEDDYQGRIMAQHWRKQQNPKTLYLAIRREAR